MNHSARRYQTERAIFNAFAAVVAGFVTWQVIGANGDRETVALFAGVTGCLLSTAIHALRRRLDLGAEARWAAELESLRAERAAMLQARPKKERARC